MADFKITCPCGAETKLDLRVPFALTEFVVGHHRTGPNFPMTVTLECVCGAKKEAGPNSGTTSEEFVQWVEEHEKCASN